MSTQQNQDNGKPQSQSQSQSSSGGGASDQPTRGGRSSSEPSAPMSPGDDAPAGTPGTGENVCPVCGGSGKQGGSDCRECSGTGKVTVGIGGA